MNQKIITIATIVFALIFVVVLAVMMNTISNKAENANTKLVDTLDANDSQSLAIYESGVMKGESVIGAIKNIKSIGGHFKLNVIVVTGAGASTTYGVNDPYSTSDSSDSKYINPVAEFSTKVNRNSNGVPVSIEFTQT